jgi:hypothetical protein
MACIKAQAKIFLSYVPSLRSACAAHKIQNNDLNCVLVWNSCAKTEIINVSVSLITAINLFCLRTEFYIIVVLWSLWQYFISGIIYHKGIWDFKSPSSAGVITIFRL